MHERSSSSSKTLLAGFILALELWDAFFKQLLSSWCWLTGRGGRPRAVGSRPAPPRVIGLILAEPHTADISLQKVARVAGWCMPYGVQQIHLYDPAGHLKQCQAVLQENLQAAAASEGRTLMLKCGWSVCRPALASPWNQREQQQGQRQQTGQQNGRRQQRTWSAWLAQQFTSTHHDQQQQQQQQAQTKQQCQGDCMTDGARVSLKAAAAAAAGAELPHPACSGMTAASNGNCSNSSSSDDGRGGSSSSSHGVTIRLLSAEDGWRPVIDAALERSNGLGGTSPRAFWPDSLRQQQLCGSGQSSQSCGLPLDAQRESSSSSSTQAAGKQDADADVEPQQHCWTPPLQEQQQQQLAGCEGRRAGVECSSCLDVRELLKHQQRRGQQQQRAVQDQVCQQETHGCQCRQQQQQQRLQKLPQQQLSLGHLQLQQHQQQQQQCVLPELLLVAELDIVDEPELLLVFGPVLSLAGYPPFHSRACEIHHLGSLAAVGRPQVADAIARYCNVLQRHGA